MEARGVEEGGKGRGDNRTAEGEVRGRGDELRRERGNEKGREEKKGREEERRRKKERRR